MLAAQASLSVDETTDHVINATKSAAVSFTVSGLLHGETGTVTSIRTRPIIRSRWMSAETGPTRRTCRHSRMDRLPRRSRPPIRRGTPPTASGNAVTLDTDSGLNPALSVNATNPVDVKFTVSGLEGDESGTVTFTDTTGRADVVVSGSNGTYSADLSNLTNGKELPTSCRSTDPAGTPLPWTQRYFWAPPVTMMAPPMHRRAQLNFQAC